MPKTRTLNRSCKTKRPKTRAGALAEVQRRIRNGARIGTIAAYPCKFGDHWHVGHKGVGRRQ